MPSQEHSEDKQPHTSNFVISAFFTMSNVHKIEQPLTLIETMNKLVQADSVLHPPILYASAMQAFDICKGFDHNVCVGGIDIERLQVVFDFIVQLVCSELSPSFVFVKVFGLELDPRNWISIAIL